MTIFILLRNNGLKIMESWDRCRMKKCYKKTGILLFWLAVWQLLAVCVGNDLLMVTPWAVLKTLVMDLGKREFWFAVAGSTGRISLGFLLGVTTAVFLSGLCVRVPWLEAFFSPVMTLVKSVPVASFAVLLLIWWGSSGLATAISFLVTLPILYLNLLQGLKNTDKRMLEMAAVFRMSFRNRFFYLYRPAIKPFVESALKLALGMCWKSGVAAEVIGTPAHSIGERMYLSKIYLDTAGVFAWTGVVIGVSIFFEKMVLFLAKQFFSHSPGCRMVSFPGQVSADQREVLLQCRKLQKTFHGEQIIRDYSKDFKKGETIFFTSPSGSGKTTLFRILCGLEQADGGNVDNAGVRFSCCFQEDRLCEEYSAIQNVAMVTGDAEKAGEALEKLLPADVLKLPCSSLSGGMKRKVAVVRAMEAESDCVILDEPYTGQDVQSRQETANYIVNAKRGRLLLIATHSDPEKEEESFLLKVST